MTAVTQARGTANFIVSESANMYRSREEVTVTATGGALVAGTVLGKITATGKYVTYDAAAETGAEDVAGILFESIGAVEAKRTIIARDAEVNREHLIYQASANDAAKLVTDAGLAALGIIVR